MRTLPFYQVDVFTDRPFAGNPLAVFPEADGLTAAQMQAIASEMNLSETTFVTEAEGDGDARVRIFTPSQELPFAGHPSVGTACQLVRLGIVRAEEPVTRVVLELDVGPTLVEVDVKGGVPVAATVHQGAPVFGDPVPRDEIAAVLCIDEDEIDPDLRAHAGRHRPHLHDHPAGLAARRWRTCSWTSTSCRRSSAITPRCTRAPSPAATTRGSRHAACSRSPGYRRTRPPAAPPGRWPPSWRATAASRRASAASSCKASTSPGPSRLVVSVGGTREAIDDVRVGGPGAAGPAGRAGPPGLIESRT